MNKITTLLFALTISLCLCACTSTQLGGPGGDVSRGDTSKGSTWQEQYDLGVRYLTEGNYQEAIIAFTAAIEIDPKMAPAYVGRGQAYVLSAETEENLTAAQADFEMAIELEGSNAEAWLGLADVYIRRGDYDKALEILRDGLEKTGQDPAIASKIAETESGNITDSSGKTRRMNHYNENGVLDWYHEYTYDALGRRDSVTHRDGAGNELGRINETYDENGNQLVSAGSNNGALFRVENEYNENGQMTRRKIYDIYGEIESHHTFQYDENGNEIRLDIYNPDGSLDEYSVREYNGNGDMTKDSYYNADGSLRVYFTWEYDSNRRRIKDSSYNADGSLRFYDTYEYSNDGRLTQRNSYGVGGVLYSYEIYHYNEQGRQIGIDTYDGYGNLQYSTLNES